MWTEKKIFKRQNREQIQWSQERSLHAQRQIWTPNFLFHELEDVQDGWGSKVKPSINPRDHAINKRITFKQLFKFYLIVKV